MTEKRKNDDLTLWGVIMDKLQKADGDELFMMAALIFLSAIVTIVTISLLYTPAASAQLAAFMTDCRAQEITQATCERLAIEFFGG